MVVGAASAAAGAVVLVPAAAVGAAEAEGVADSVALDAILAACSHSNEDHPKISCFSESIDVFRTGHKTARRAVATEKWDAAVKY